MRVKNGRSRVVYAINHNGGTENEKEDYSVTGSVNVDVRNKRNGH